MVTHEQWSRRQKKVASWNNRQMLTASNRLPNGLR